MKNAVSKKLFWILIVLLFVAFTYCLFIPSGTAYAGTTIEIVDNPYYVNRYSYNTTKNYYEYGVKNDVAVYDRQNDIVGFDIGASVLKDDVNSLVFTFNLLRPSLERMSNTKKACIIVFSIVEASRDGKNANSIIDLCLFSYWNSDDNCTEFLFGMRRNEYNEASVSVEGCEKGKTYYSNSFSALDFIVFSSIDFEVLGAYTRGDYFFPTKSSSMKLAIKTNSPYTRYFVRCSMLSSGSEYYADSSVVSVYDVLKNMEPIEGFDGLPTTSKETADSILNDVSFETVKVVYLERIGDTPFAREKDATIYVPQSEQTLYPYDVANSLGLSSFGVMQSACERFVWDEQDQCYRAHYLVSVSLASVASNGEVEYYYLDCNLSYQDYYGALVNAGAIDENTYNYFRNAIKQEWAGTEVERYDADKLYGYWGYVCIPQAHDFNSFMFEFFDAGQANYKGVVQVYERQTHVSQARYNSLLAQYHYNWFTRIWANFVSQLGDSFKARDYVFYVDSGVTEAFVSQNGSDTLNTLSRFGNFSRDASYAVAEEMNDVYQKIKSWFDDNFGSVIKTVLIVLGAIIAGYICLRLLLIIVFKASKLAGKKKKNDGKNVTQDDIKKKKKSQKSKTKTKISRVKNVKSQKKKE